MQQQRYNQLKYLSGDDGEDVDYEAETMKTLQPITIGTKQWKAACLILTQVILSEPRVREITVTS